MLEKYLYEPRKRIYIFLVEFIFMIAESEFPSKCGGESWHAEASQLRCNTPKMNSYRHSNNSHTFIKPAVSDLKFKQTSPGYFITLLLFSTILIVTTEKNVRFFTIRFFFRKISKTFQSVFKKT